MFPFGSIFGAFARPELPIECKCGDASAETCTQTGLRNHLNAPPFAYLPEENDVDESFYALDGGMYSPTRHWVLVGEIVELNFFVRPRVVIKTQYGERILVNFHLDTPSPTFFTWDDLKPKHTLAIFYAVNRTFMDMNQGIRQENPDTVMAFPCPLDNLMDEFQGYLSVVNNGKTCFHCGKIETDDHKLSKCIRCKKVFYCGRECQSPHWTKSHKRLCRYAPMLLNLSKLDFSRFDDFVDWGFPITVPPTPQEKKAKATKALLEALYNMGATSAGGSMPRRVDEFLSLIEDKDTLSAIQNLCSEDSPIMMMLKEDGNLPERVRDTFLIKSLKEFTCAVITNPDLRHHVVDLKASGSFAIRNTQEFTNDTLLSSLFAAIPLWQHEECVSGISWCFESHYPCHVISHAFKSNTWELTGDNDSLLIKNRVSGTSVFLSDHKENVTELSKAIAEAQPDKIVMRVIRVTAHESWADCVRRIASDDDLPTNVYTLWIREDVALCGSFNPLNRDTSLVEQLLDRKEVSMTELLLQRLGVKEENIIRRNPSVSEFEEDRTCFSCGELKAEECFSNTQRRKYGNKARCKDCVSLSA